MNQFLKTLDTELSKMQRKRPWLSEQTGISISTINSWYKNDRYPTVEALMNISETLDLSIDYLIFGRDRYSVDLAKNSEILTVWNKTDQEVRNVVLDLLTCKIALYGYGGE